MDEQNYDKEEKVTTSFDETEKTEERRDTDGVDCSATAGQTEVGSDNPEPQKVKDEDTLGKLICPRCRAAFDPKEKHCPYCGLKNNLKLCKTCGATIARSAKRCPKCGAKNKKVLYKRVWFWILLVIVVMVITTKFSSNAGKGTEENESISSEAIDSNEAIDSKITASSESLNEEEKAVVGEWEGVYLFDLSNEKMGSLGDDVSMHLKFNADHTGTISTTTGGDTDFKWSYETTTEKGDKVYKAGNVTIAVISKRNDEFGKKYAGDMLIYIDDTAVILEHQNTKSTSSSSTPIKIQSRSFNTTKGSDSSVTSSQKNALSKAESYLNCMAFSYAGLIEQLEYEGYSTSDATYAVDHCGADWNEQAVKKAESYLRSMSFSESGLIEQLEYEGFTHEQAVYGVKKAY